MATAVEDADASWIGLQQLQGTWRLVEIWDIEEDQKLGSTVKALSTIDGDRIETVIQHHNKPAVTFKGRLVVGTDGVSIDLEITEPTKVRGKGIFRVSGNRMERAFALKEGKEGGERPTAFEEPGQRYSVWERVDATLE